MIKKKRQKEVELKNTTTRQNIAKKFKTIKIKFCCDIKFI